MAGKRRRQDGRSRVPERRGSHPLEVLNALMSEESVVAHRHAGRYLALWGGILVSSEPDDRWCDAGGARIPVGCRVEQVGLAAGWGTRRSRLYERGTVIGRRHRRLLVRFDGELAWVSLRPRLVRVLGEEADLPLPLIEHVIATLEQLRARLPAPTESRPPIGAEQGSRDAARNSGLGGRRGM